MVLNKGFPFVLAAHEDLPFRAGRSEHAIPACGCARIVNLSKRSAIDFPITNRDPVVSRAIVPANLYFGFILGDYKHARPPFRERARARARETAPDSEYIRGISGTCATYGIYARRPFACQI
jgi:hypothetical protein